MVFIHKINKQINKGVAAWMTEIKKIKDLVRRGFVKTKPWESKGLVSHESRHINTHSLTRSLYY